jgi:hypothetical protein
LGVINRGVGGAGWIVHNGGPVLRKGDDHFLDIRDAKAMLSL